MLKLIDLGAEDVEEVEDTLEVYVSPDKLSEMHKKLEEGGFVIKQAELYMRPVNWMTIADPNTAQKAENFLEVLDELDDVSKVFSNLDIPDASK
jgi:transcriptional/translational regulatory protein YebC/TACO1